MLTSDNTPHSAGSKDMHLASDGLSHVIGKIKLRQIRSKGGNMTKKYKARKRRKYKYK